MSRGKWEDYDHSDQEIDTYQQSCDNCINCSCPMMLPETAEEYYEDYGTLDGFDSVEAAEKMGIEIPEGATKKVILDLIYSKKKK